MYYNYNEAAEKLGISRRTLETWVYKSEIPFTKFGKKFVRFSDEDLKSVVRKTHTSQPQARIQ